MLRDKKMFTVSSSGIASIAISLEESYQYILRCTEYKGANLNVTFFSPL